jgi:hypothetical protein
MILFQGLFTASSWQTFTYLACGRALATNRHTITTYLWLTGATTVKHFSRFYVFLGCPLYNRRWHLWDAVIRVVFDDKTKKKAGAHIAGLARSRNGASPARQEYRTLRGWPGHSLSVPVGLERYLKPAQAETLKVPYRSRSQLARDLLDFVAEQLPTRHIRRLADGGYTTKDYVRQLPDAAHRVGRFPISAKLYTGLPLSAQDIVNEYSDRWAVESEIRAANACNGLGQDQCRKRQRILGANTFRLVLAAARTLWCIDQVERGTGLLLGRYRPWYRQKVAPSQLDVVWTCREALHKAGIFPIPRFIPDLAENHGEPEHAFPLAA